MNNIVTRRLRELFYSETQYETARRLNTALSVVSRWVNGQAKPSADLIIRICKEYNVSADWILGLSDVK